MSCNVNLFLLIITLLSFNPNTEIFGTSLEFKPNLVNINMRTYDFKNPIKKSSEKQNKDQMKKEMYNSEKILKVPNSGKDYKVIDYDNTIVDQDDLLYADDNPEEDIDYDATIFDPNESFSPEYLTDVGSEDNKIRNFRRATITNESSIYPTVLVKPFEIGSISNRREKGGVLNNIAQKMNISTLELAEKLTQENGKDNGQFEKTIQDYLTNNVLFESPNAKQKESANQNLKIHSKTLNNGEYLENNAMTSSSLNSVLDKILNKLESIDEAKNNDTEGIQPDGAPCDIIGSWSSSSLGLCFDIQFSKDKIDDISSAEINNKILTITVMECTPPKRHNIIDLDWKFTGSAIKERGGPFYMYGQKRSENLIVTFLGFCRTCGDIDTIFSTWNLLLPSKDCSDMSMAFETKHDILRKVCLEEKRKHRFKNILYQSRRGRS